MEPAGIYIHIPFCQRKCTYCNFNTTDFEGEAVPAYVKAVSKEIKHWAGLINQNGAGEAGTVVDSIYFGGGTPSIIDAKHIQSLIEACRFSFQVRDNVEITIEINPGSFARSKLDCWRNAGVNRASVGVQSFIDREV
ncbi:MAG TPA: radical SAM protein, partial [Blastocatellia bacterium]|nr:radical SAM protein [Blastocatellia bacterium]